MESVRVKSYPLAYHAGWAMDLDALERAMTERTRAIVLVNPNNPTGSFVKRDELEALVRIARDRDCALISDEVFADYGFAPDERRVATLAGVGEAPAFSMSGLSKIAGLPQMKLGWIVVSGPEAARREAMARLELIADTYLSVATPVQWAAPALLEAGAAVRAAIVQRTRNNLEFFRAAVAREPAFRILALEGGWYAILQAPRTRTEEEWVLELLAERDVLVQPGFFYDFESEAFLVVSLLAPPEVFREGVNRIVAPSYNMRST
jgi:aspartate/methionine/tyrosine aminotransferase